MQVAIPFTVHWTLPHHYLHRAEEQKLNKTWNLMFENAAKPHVQTFKIWF